MSVTQEQTPSSELPKFIQYWNQTEIDKWKHATPDQYYFAQLAKETRDGFNRLVLMIGDLVRAKGKARPVLPKLSIDDFMLTMRKVGSEENDVSVKRVAKESSKKVEVSTTDNNKKNLKKAEHVRETTEEEIKVREKFEWMMNAYVVMNMRTGMTVSLPPHLQSLEGFKQWLMTRSRK